MGAYGQLTKVKVNSSAVVNLLKSSEVAGNLAARGAAIQGALPTSAGEEWEVKSFLGRDRAQVIVKTSNQEARVAAANNALQFALGAGR